MYHEEQRFSQWWAWTLMGATSLCMIVVFGYGMYQQFVLGKPFGDDPMSDTALAVVGSAALVLTIGITALFAALKLVTDVREDGITLRFFPIATKRIAFADIESCKAATYRPIRDYGGWGIKRGPAGTAFNISGNRGVKLRMANGKSLLIGSQDHRVLADAILARMRR